MSVPDPIASEESLDDCLLAYEQQQHASGDSRDHQASEVPTSPALRERFERARHCVDLLASVRAARGAVAAAPAGNGVVDAELCTAAPRHIGRFEIRELVGIGGFGIVYRAFDPSTGRQVALKIPRPELLSSPEVRQRFAQESRAAARLDHPHIVQILEAGTAETTPYIASIYYAGPTLARWLAQQVRAIDTPTGPSQYTVTFSSSTTGNWTVHVAPTTAYESPAPMPLVFTAQTPP